MSGKKIERKEKNQPIIDTFSSELIWLGIYQSIVFEKALMIDCALIVESNTP